MKKTFMVLCISAAIGIFAFGLPAVAADEAPVLRVVENDWPPYYLTHPTDSLPGFAREILSLCLQSMGYRAEAASAGEAALEILAQRRFDLLLLDMMMEPGIDGLETYRRCLGFNPDQRAVICSGYSHSDRIREALVLGNCRYIKKPFHFDDLKRVVAEALEATPKSGSPSLTPAVVSGATSHELGSQDDSKMKAPDSIAVSANTGREPNLCHTRFQKLPLHRFS